MRHEGMSYIFFLDARVEEEFVESADLGKVLQHGHLLLIDFFEHHADRCVRCMGRLRLLDPSHVFED